MPSDTLALVFGGYMLVAGVKILAHPEAYQEIVEGLRASPALSFLCGVLIYFLGALLLAGHHDLSTPLRAFVTIFAGLMALEGALMMAVPNLVLAVPAGIGFQHHSRAWGVFASLLGAGIVAWAMIWG